MVGCALSCPAPWVDVEIRDDISTERVKQALKALQ